MNKRHLLLIVALLGLLGLLLLISRPAAGPDSPAPAKRGCASMPAA